MKKISFDAAVEIAREMVGQGEVDPSVEMALGDRVRVAFFAYVPLAEVSEDTVECTAEPKTSERICEVDFPTVVEAP